MHTTNCHHFSAKEEWKPKIAKPKLFELSPSCGQGPSQSPPKTKIVQIFKLVLEVIWDCSTTATN